MSTNNPSPTNPLPQWDDMFPSAGSPIGSNHSLEYQKSNITTSSPPGGQPVGHRNGAGPRTCEALQQTVDRFNTCYPGSAFWTITIKGRPTLALMKAHRDQFFRRLRKQYPKAHCVWVLAAHRSQKGRAAHPRPHLHLLLNAHYPMRQMLKLLAKTCFGFVTSRPLEPQERSPGAFRYLVTNVIKTVEAAHLPKMVRKWGVMKGPAATANVRCPVRKVVRKGPLHEIWRQFGWLFAIPAADLLARYRAYGRGFYYLPDGVSNFAVDALLRNRTAWRARRGKRPRSKAQFRQRLKWVAINAYLGKGHPSEALHCLRSAHFCEHTDATWQTSVQPEEV